MHNYKFKKNHFILSSNQLYPKTPSGYCKLIISDSYEVKNSENINNNIIK